MWRVARGILVILSLVVCLWAEEAPSSYLRGVHENAAYGTLLAFSDDGEESTWKWEIGGGGSRVEVATVDHGLLNAKLSPEGNAIRFSGGRISHSPEENDIVEMRFKTMVYDSDITDGITTFSVYCYTAENHLICFNNHKVNYANAEKEQTIQLYTDTSFNANALHSGDVIEKFVIVPYPDGACISAEISIDYLYIGPAGRAPSALSVPDGDLFFDFTNDEADRQRYSLGGYNRIQYDETSAVWKSSGVKIVMNRQADCAEDERMLAHGTLELVGPSGSLQDFNLQTSGLTYTGNKDDVYAEIRVRVNDFVGGAQGILAIYPRSADGSDYITLDGAPVCLSTTFSLADIGAQDYVILRFTNASQFFRWQRLEAIDNLSIEFSADGMEAMYSLSYDYIYIGSARQTHVMMDFDTAGQWKPVYSVDSDHYVTDLSTHGGRLYGTYAFSGPKNGYALAATENQFLYAVRNGDMVRIRMKLGRNDGTIDEMHIGMGVGGAGYRSGYGGTSLSIPMEQLKFDGSFHEYTIKIPADSSIVGKPLRSLACGLIGRGTGQIAFEIDYIYIGSEVNFSAYTGFSSSKRESISAENYLPITDDALIDLRLFRYSYHAFEILSVSDPATVIPYLSENGYPLIEPDGTGAVELRDLFDETGSAGVHSYAPVNSLFRYDSETYSYDSTKNAIAYDTETDMFYVANAAEDGFVPFYSDAETGDPFGFSIEMNFRQTDAVFNLSCMDNAWVYIDGVLVLDLGGNSVYKSGEIDFANGKISIYADGKTQTHNLLEKYQAAGKKAVTQWDGNTFAKDSTHSLKIFFINSNYDRSQFKLAFNLSPIVLQSDHSPIEHRYAYTNNDVDHTAICELCGLTVQDMHNFLDAVCVCGAVEGTTPLLEDSIRIRHTLNLESGIILNYAVAVAELQDFDSFYLQCTLPVYEKNEQVGATTVEIQPSLNGNYYYFPLEGLSAVQMNDVIQARVLMYKGGRFFCSKADRFSVADYIYSLLNRASTDDNLKSLCANLLRYGAEAQHYKEYRTDFPVDAKMTSAHRTYLRDTSSMDFCEADQLLDDLDKPIAKWVGKALSLEAQIGIKLVFDAGELPIEDLSVRVRYQDDLGVEHTVTLTDISRYNASYYAVTCYALTIAELRTIITATIYNGDQQVSRSLQYSAESYAAKTAGTSLEPLCRALLAYCDSAHAYFSKQER